MKKKTFLLLMIFAIALTPVFGIKYVSAQPLHVTSVQTQTADVAQSSGSACTEGKICNPLGSATTIQQVLAVVLDGIQIIAGVISVVYIILAGLKFVLAAGSPDKIKEARKMLLYVVIGIAILLGANGISLVVQNTITQVVNGSK